MTKFRQNLIHKIKILVGTYHFSRWPLPTYGYVLIPGLFCTLSLSSEKIWKNHFLSFSDFPKANPKVFTTRLREESTTRYVEDNVLDSSQPSLLTLSLQPFASPLPCLIWSYCLARVVPLDVAPCKFDSQKKNKRTNKTVHSLHTTSMSSYLHPCNGHRDHSTRDDYSSIRDASSHVFDRDSIVRSTYS